MTTYYSEKLCGRRLERCYDLAQGRLQQYLDAEILHAQKCLRSTDTALELGCGYGRITAKLARVTGHAVGIDNAYESLALAGLRRNPGDFTEYIQMDALELGFKEGSFDAVLCLQNGICAFGVNKEELLREALRVTRDGGTVLLSSYSDSFWKHRLSWFISQAEEGLVGPIDSAASGKGFIVCEDGFRSGRLTPDDFHSLCSRIGVKPQIVEVDESSIFCKLIKQGF